MKNTTLEFSQEEIKMLLEIINAVSFQGNSVERIYSLKLKIKSALEPIFEADKGDQEDDRS